MSKKIKRLHATIRFLKGTAITIMGISLLLLVLFSGETISPEYDKFQYILLFSIMFVLIMSFSLAIFIEKKLIYSKFIFDIEYEDFLKRANRINESFNKKIEMQECLIDICEASFESLKELKRLKNEAITELKKEYLSLYQS